MADRIYRGARAPKNEVNPYVIGPPEQLLLNKFFDPSTPSMRKVDDGEEKRKKRKEKQYQPSGEGGAR